MKIKPFRLIMTLMGLIMIFISCSKESNVGRFEDAVVDSNGNSNKFRQITFTLNLTDGSNKYVNITHIDSVKLNVNGKYWGTFASEIIDTSFRTTTVVNDVKYSDSKINYLIIAPYQLKTDNLNTAGDFVNYLSDRIVLTAGDYVCEVSEIKFKNIKDQWRILKPQVYKDFKVVDNTTSSFVGEISLIIK